MKEPFVSLKCPYCEEIIEINEPKELLAHHIKCGFCEGIIDLQEEN